MDEDEPTERTEQGLEIPIPKREDVIANLKKAAKPVPQLDAYAADGVGGRVWRISCRTCGWKIEGEGKTPRGAHRAAKAHPCSAGNGSG